MLFDIVITLCDSVREVCPTFSASPELVHWSLADPSQETTEEQMRAAFEQVADEISRRDRQPVLMLDERRIPAA